MDCTTLPPAVLSFREGMQEEGCKVGIPAKLPALVAALPEVPVLPSLRW
jgi:hypothetical protein